ncbi:MAG: CaiB/BaiF CoA transferase family protein [Candidatus Njordarchaeia archaeon]
MGNLNLLDGVRVLDLTRLLPGGFCTLILSDLGAEVIKVEEPEIGDYVRYFPPFIDGESVYHIILNRGKKSVSLDLKKDSDREKFFELVKKSDVIVEGFRAGVVEKLGVDFESVKKVNPKIMYCSVRGFMEKEIDRPIHDLNAVGLSGILDLTKLNNGEIEKLPIPIADLAAGSMCAIGILAGLLKSKLEGKPVKVDVGLVESSIFWNIVNFATVIGGKKVKDFFTVKKTSYYDIYKTKDGKYVTLAAIEEKFWKKFVEKLGLPSSNRENEDYHLIIEKKISEITREELLEKFRNNPVCLEPVYSIEEILNKNLFKHTTPQLPHHKIPAITTPLKINGKNIGNLNKAPKLGENQNKT